jgi:hypothetical protein
MEGSAPGLPWLRMFFGNASRFFEEMIANWTDSAVFRSFPVIPACPVNPVYHGNAAKTH